MFGSKGRDACEQECTQCHTYAHAHTDGKVGKKYNIVLCLVLRYSKLQQLARFTGNKYQNGSS